MPLSPSDMTSSLERRIVSGEGMMYPGADGESETAPAPAPIDETWPDAFLDRIGETISVRVSSETGCYDFSDESGTVFWIEVPVAPLTWNWVAPFLRPFSMFEADRSLLAPWHFAAAWRLTTEELENSRGPEPRRSPRRLAEETIATNLCFTAFFCTETNLFFAAAWTTNETLPDNMLDLYGSTNLLSPSWLFLSSHPATNPPAGFAVERAALPWYVEPTQHVHDATCESITNVVASPLDGVTVYTNVVWSCATNRVPGEAGFFRLGTHHDSDGDGLPDAYERLVAGSDPENPDTDGDGVPDGLTWSEWRSHPLWAENGDGTNLVVFLYEPVTNGFAALRFDDLCIPLTSNAGPWCLCIPTNAVVDCTLVSGADTVAMLWYGPPEAVEWTPANRSAPGPRWAWDVPDDVAVPIWCDRPAAVFGGNSGGGSCRFARPTLRIRSEEPGQEGFLDVCVHGTDGIARFSWSVEPAPCTGLWAFATGCLSDSGDGRTFCIDVSDAVPGLAGARTGTLHVGSLQAPFFGDDSLFGTLSGTVSAHRCAGLADPSFGFCLSCGVAHGGPPDACSHEPWCATKTNLLADCDCAEPFVRIGGARILRLVGEDIPCCSVHAGFSSFADVLSAPGALHAGVSNGVFLAVEPESRSPTIGGFVARCRIDDGEGGAYRDLSVPFTCADLGIDPLPGNAPVPYNWQNDPESYYVTNGTLFVARRSAPYPIRLWNESPSDARLVFDFAVPTNGPGLFDPSLVTRHSSFVTTNASPFSALNSDTTVYLDASCSNALATLSLTLSNPATNRTFLAESLSVQVVDTDLGEHRRVRSATDRLSWDFSDAPEDVYAYLWIPGVDTPFGQLVGFSKSRAPSFSLDLPPGDYFCEAYFPRVYGGSSDAFWSTNYLHVRPVPEFVRDVTGVQCRTDRRVEVALTSDSFYPDVEWTLSPIVANGPRLFASSNSVSAATSFVGISNVWVSAGTVPGVYRVTASYPGFTNATAFVVDPVVDINGDFLRNGSIADDPREADPVCFTNSVGIVVPCNNNDDDGDGIPDCLDNSVNVISDLADLSTISISALGLSDIPQDLLARLSLNFFCAHDESDSFQNVWPCEKVRFFNADASHGMLPISPETQIVELNESILFSPTGAMLNVEGILPGASAFCGLIMSVDGDEIGHDAISFLVAPVLVLSNTDICLSAFVGDSSGSFATNVEELLQGVCNVEILSNSMFPQDCAELSQTTVPLSGNSFQTTILEFLQSNLSTFVGDAIGLSHVTNSLANDGGNVETTPPIAGFPFGRLLLGENCGFGTVNFLTNQMLQTRNDGPIFLPLSWLSVGHVDEVVSFIPSNDGFHCLVADFGLATNLLINSTNQWDRHFPLPANGAISAITNSANGAAVECVVTNLVEIRTRITSSLQIDPSRIVSVPVLFSPPNEVEGRREFLSHAIVPNMVNLLAVVSPVGTRRLIVPDPAFKPYRDYMTALLLSLGYSSNEFVFVETDELHSHFGEAHCGSNVQRIRIP